MSDPAQHQSAADLLDKVRQLNHIGIALSAEKDQARLLEKILSSARTLTQADAGTLYLMEPDGQQLRFALVQNDTLNIHLGGTGAPVGNEFPLLSLYQADGTPNERMVVAWSVLHKTTLRIGDAYSEENFDFAGTRAFDRNTGYRSQSFLTVPLQNHEGDVIAALQLINKKDAAGHTLTFDVQDQELAESLASQAAIALTNRRLIDELRLLFDRFTEVIAHAIDAKSPHTGAHCRRVPETTLLLARAASGSNFPGLEGFYLSDDDFYELKIAAWLHDCGKVVTPPHIMEKATKLHLLTDRIDAVMDRLEILRLNLQLQHLQQQLDSADYERQLQQLTDARSFLQRVNKGSEFTSDEDIARIKQLASLSWQDAEGTTRRLLSDEEVLNLSIRRGTLNSAERQIMEDHMVHTLNMLEQLPFPKYLQRVPEYAGGHHERMDGKGYPRGLTRDQLSIPARMVGIADVFEALTSHERPYKQPMKLSQALTIMGRMVEDQHLDPDLFALFVHHQVYLEYARAHLTPEQLDEPDITQLPGLHLARISQTQTKG